MLVTEKEIKTDSKDLPKNKTARLEIPYWLLGLLGNLQAPKMMQVSHLDVRQMNR